jgi:hypothetical protein
MAAKSKKTAAPIVRKTVSVPAAKAALSGSGKPKLVVSQQELDQRIRDRAYFNYLNRGACESGCAKQDWYDAEKQVRKELGLR